MRTTVDINERVLERARRHASSSGQTLGAVVSEALSAYLSARSRRSDAPFELIVRGRADARFPSPEQIAAAEEEEELSQLAIAPRADRAAS